jgi:hypothetical protein
MKYLEALQAKALGGGLGFRGQSFSGFTGTMAAGLAAGSTVFATRYPLLSYGLMLMQAIHLHYTCIGTFSAPVTAGRRLSLRRGSGGDPSGGTAIDVMRNLEPAPGGGGAWTSGELQAETLLTGQVATTGALTMTGVTYEAATRARLLLSHVGTSGQDYDEIWAPEEPFYLHPGNLAGIIAPQTFDAAGTWQLNVKGYAVELTQ